MEVLITGASGLVGNNVARQMISAGHRVHVLVRRGSSQRSLENLDVVQHFGDVQEIDSIRAAAQSVTHIVHSAAMIHIGWRGVQEQRRVNVEGTRNVAQVALERSAKLVHVSTVNTLGLTGTHVPAHEKTPFGPSNIRSTYVVTKREADEVIGEYRRQGLSATIVHPGFMLGPWDWKTSSGKMLLEVSKGFALVAPRGGCSLCDVRDVAAGIISASQSDHWGEDFILAGHNLDYVQLWTRFADVTSAPKPVAAMKSWLGKTIGVGGDIAGRLAGKEGVVNSAAISMSEQLHYYSSEKAMRMLNYRIRDAHETISDAWLWFVQQGYVPPRVLARWRSSKLPRGLTNPAT